MHTSPGIDLSFLDEPPPPRRLTPQFVATVQSPNLVGGWNAAYALHLEEVADALVERLRVSGLDPSILTAAAQCVDAHQRRDLFGVRDACLAIEERARELAVRKA